MCLPNLEKTGTCCGVLCQVFVQCLSIMRVTVRIGCQADEDSLKCEAVLQWRDKVVNTAQVVH